MANEEAIIKATSWWQGFLEGREDGYRVGLTLGVRTALEFLEQMVKETGQGKLEEKLAQECRDLEHKLLELGFVRKADGASKPIGF